MPASVKFFLQAWNLFLKSKLGLQLGSPGQVSKQGPPLLCPQWRAYFVSAQRYIALD
jgi:hypothetical protein